MFLSEQERYQANYHFNYAAFWILVFWLYSLNKHLGKTNSYAKKIFVAHKIYLFLNGHKALLMLSIITY